MFSKSLVASVLALAVSVQVSAHAAVAPALGVSGTPVRGDVQRPSTAKPCGKVNIAQTLETSTPIVAAADGTFTATAKNFNAGKDGSLQFTMSVDATATGKNFVAGTVSQNGQLAPAAVTTTQIVAQLPAGTKCTGGAAGNLCLASFKSAGNFGNCVVVQQGAATATGAATGGAAGAAGGAATAAGGAAAGAAGGAAGASAGAPATAKGKSKAGKAPAGGAGRPTAVVQGDVTNVAVNGDDVVASAAGNGAVKAAASGKGSVTAVAVSGGAAGGAAGGAGGATGATAGKKPVGGVGRQAGGKRFVPVGTRAPRALLHALRSQDSL